MTGSLTLKNIEIDWQSLLRKSGLSALTLLYLFSFISKSAVNIMGGLALLISLIYIGYFKRDIIKNNHYLLILLLPYFIGFFLSFFSLAGFSGALNFLNRHKFMLMLIPLTAFIENKKNLNYMYAVLVTSAVVASVYGIYMYTTTDVFRTFYPIGRFGDMLVVVILANIVFFLRSDFRDIKKNIIFKTSSLALTGLFILSLLLTCQRGSWLGFFFGITVFGLLYDKRILILLVAGVFLMTAVPNNNNVLNTFKNKIISIIDTENNDGNVARLQMWKAGLDFAMEHLFFGAGPENVDKPLKKFFFSQPKEYQKKYEHAVEYRGRLHNSYLQILVESGIFYFLIYLSSLFYILIGLLKKIARIRNDEKSYVITALISSIGFLIPQFFHNDLYSYAVNAYYMVLFSACFVANRVDVNGYVL